MSFKILITAPYLQPFLSRFEPVFKEKNCEIIAPKVKERFEEDELLQWIGDIDGVICGDDRFTEKVLDNAPKLKVISKWGTGIDSINQDACKARGIKVCNTPNAFTIPVSDTVLAYMLDFSRNITSMNNAMHAGEWKKINGTALHECTLGVIGVGNIGESVLRKAKAFSMKLFATDIKMIPSDLVIELGIEVVELEELLKQSDYVSVNCDLNPTSHHLMNDTTFSFMKENAVIINTARGPIIDEQALIRALQNKKIAGAALDVFEHEPLPLDSPLIEMTNVLMAPHNSNSSPFAWEGVHWNTINNMFSVLFDE